MAIEIPLWMQNPDYPARIDRQFIHEQWDEGVMDLASFALSAGSGPFKLAVSAGRAVIVGDNQPNQGSYLVVGTGGDEVTIGAAPGSNSRYDIVILRVNDPDAGGPAGDNATLAVIAGTVAASPVVPATPTSAIRLGIVGPITSSTTNVSGLVAEGRMLAGRKCSPGVSEVWTGPESLVPNGWLIEGGQPVSRTGFPRLHALYAAMGYPYGSGDGTTTFNVRDKRGRVGVGLDSMGPLGDAGRLSVANVLGGAGGTETVALTLAQTPVHGHTVPAHSHTGPNHAHASPIHNHTFVHDHPTGGTVSAAGVGTFYTDLTVHGDAPGGPSSLLFTSPGSTASLLNVATSQHNAFPTGNSAAANTGFEGTGLTSTQPATAVDNVGTGAAHPIMQPYLLENSIVRT